MNTRKPELLIGVMAVFALGMFSCAPQPVEPTESSPEPEPSPTITIKHIVPTESIQEMPLSGLGDYPVGIRRNIIFYDENRSGREVILTIWYPAKGGQGEPGTSITDAEPELSGAPYPVILSSSKVGFIFARSLVSHGFTYVGVNKIDSYPIYDNNLIDQPLDILFALKMMAENPPEGLDGVINTDIAGTIGYSFDAFNSLAMSGARIDPEAYLADCASAEIHVPIPPDWWIEYICTLSNNWADFEAHAGPAITESDNGLWQPITDARIKAVMPMGPEGAWIFNERGLAAVDRPVFLVSAEKDDLNIYDLEAAVLYDQIGFSEKYMVTILGKGHMMIYDPHVVDQMRHFANAFFGYYLQGRDDYLDYFSEDFISQYDGLAWGVTQGE